MQLGLTDKVAVVTGAGAGIGRAVALSLAAEGVRVAAASLDRSELDDLIEKLRAIGGEHLVVPVDLAVEGAPAQLIQQVRANIGRVDIVVNNVGGTLNVTDPFAPLADWRRVWRLNFEVALEINALVLPDMRSQQWGRVVNISSISGAENHGPIPYCSAKAALIAYTRSMGRLVSPDGVIMTAVLPGAVFTTGGYWDNAQRSRPKHVDTYVAERMAIHRLGRVEEISSVVTFLCSQGASFCVGSIVPVDGGQGRMFFGV